MNDACQRYAEDPEANTAHLSECAACRALYGGVETKPVIVDALPLAAWEGASYRAWPLVIGGMFTVLAIALALCAAAGISPLSAIAFDVQANIARASVAYQKLRAFGPVVFAVPFVAVNCILVLLLRRAPRGIDA